MKYIPDKSIDMILCDLPYGTTACKWDTIIPFEPLWKQYKRIIKDHGCITLTASQPFTSILVNSNLKMFRYEWIWEKDNHTNFLTIKKQPGKRHENILIFYKKQPIYNPIMWIGKKSHKQDKKLKSRNREYLGLNLKALETIQNQKKYPISILYFKNLGRGKGIHPTQKPVELFKYLIKTYTNENDLVLDNCIGSGTTAIACLETGRRYIGIEKEQKYYRIAKKRIMQWEKDNV